jgi:hypothetical protein
MQPAEEWEEQKMTRVVRSDKNAHPTVLDVPGVAECVVSFGSVADRG